jgi:hypothetical protein
MERAMALDTDLVLKVHLPGGLPADVDPAVVQSLEKAVERATALMLQAVPSAQVLARADALADQLASMAGQLVEPGHELLEERLRRVGTIRRMLAEGDWLTAEEINRLQPAPPVNRSLPASDWKRRGRIFGVAHGGREYYARWQLDAGYAPLPVIKPVLEALGAGRDPWALAAWFHFPNAWLTRRAADGNELAVAPKDLLHEPDAVLEAARHYDRSYVA